MPLYQSSLEHPSSQLRSGVAVERQVTSLRRRGLVHAGPVRPYGVELSRFDGIEGDKFPAGTGFDMHRKVLLKHLVEAEDVPEPAEPAEPVAAENPLLA